MAAGTAKRSAIAARMNGVCTVAKAICPIARVAPPAPVVGRLILNGCRSRGV